MLHGIWRLVNNGKILCLYCLKNRLDFLPMETRLDSGV